MLEIRPRTSSDLDKKDGTLIENGATKQWVLDVANHYSHVGLSSLYQSQQADIIGCSSWQRQSTYTLSVMSIWMMQFSIRLSEPDLSAFLSMVQDKKVLLVARIAC
jgi:hypothetical protein